MGMLQLEFTLSDEPELGEWKIHFMAGPVSSKAGFKVSEYVLPKFEVRCQLFVLYHQAQGDGNVFFSTAGYNKTSVCCVEGFCEGRL